MRGTSMLAVPPGIRGQSKSGGFRGIEESIPGF